MSLAAAEEKGNGKKKQSVLVESRKALPSPVVSVDLMIYGHKDTVIIAKRQLSLAFMAEYQIQGSFIQNGVLYEIPLPDYDAIRNIDTFNATSKNNLCENAYKKYINDVEVYKGNLAKMHAKLLMVLDKAGSDKVESQPEFAAIDANKYDPLALWNLIRKVYISAGVVSLNNAIDKRIQAKKEFDTYYQTDKMSNLDHRKQLEYLVENLVTAGVPMVPDDEELGMQLLLKANRGKYGDEIQRFRSNVSQGIAHYPVNLAAAAALLDAMTPSKVRHSGNNGGNGRNNTAFVASGKKNKDDKVEKSKKKDIEELKKKNPCHKCGELGHWANECPNKAKDTRELSSNMAHIAFLFHANAANGPPMMPSTAVLDTGASGHCINDPRLCYDIQDINQSVQGINGPMKVSKKGKVRVFGDCIIAPDLPISLISASQVEKIYQVRYVQGEAFEVYIRPGVVIRFKLNEHGLYTCNLHDVLNNFASFAYVSSCVSTVPANKLGYSPSEVRKAEGVKILLRKFGFPSPAEIRRLLNDGGLLNCPYTSDDILNNINIFGPDPAYVKGTMKDIGPVGQLRSENSIIVKESQTLHSDLMYFDGVPFLLSVAKPINLLLTKKLSSRNIDHIRDILSAQVDILLSRKFPVSDIYCDGEFKSLDRQYVNNALVHVTGSSEPTAESAGRVLKEKVRSVTMSVPWKVPLEVNEELVTFCTSMTNWLPRQSGIGVSARQALEGRKLDLKELDLSFGDYCQVYDKNNCFPNSVTKSRSIGCIAMRPEFNGRGSWRFYNPTTRKFITSDNWKLLPTPVELIDRMNYIATEMATQRRAARNPVNVVEQDAEAPVQVEVPVARVEEIQENLNIPEPPRRIIEIIEDSIANNADIVPDLVNDNDNTFDTDDIIGSDAASMSMMAFLQMNVNESMKVNEDLTKAGMKKEVRQVVDKAVFKCVHLKDLTDQEKKEVIPCHMICKPKTNDDGSLREIKARLVGGGNKQVEKDYYKNSTSSTVKTISIFALLAEAASRRAAIKTIDIEGAYLEADMDEILHMRIKKNIADIMVELYPDMKQYQNPDGSIYVKLLKALYGTLRAALLWQKRLSEVLKKHGFIQSVDDECVWYKLIDNELMKLAFHVDDIMAIHGQEKILEQELKSLGSEFSGYTMNNSDKFVYLGMTISRNKNGDVMVSMEQYILKICEEHGVNKTSKIPASKDLFAADTSELIGVYEKIDYHNGVAQCLYVSKRIRSEILCTSSFLCSKVNCPTVKNKSQLYKMLSYLYGTRNRGMIFRGGAELIPVVYGDAAFMAHDDLRSRGGNITMMCGGVIAAHSSKQTILTQSATEAELVSMHDSGISAMEIKRVLNGTLVVTKAIKVYEDNTGVLDMLRAGKPMSQRTKHISMRYFTICDYIQRGDIQVEWCSTHNMIADILTKPLDGVAFKKFRDIVAPIIDKEYL